MRMELLIYHEVGGIPVNVKTIANNTTVCVSSDTNVIVIGVE